MRNQVKKDIVMMTNIPKLLDIILSFIQMLGLPPLGQSKEKDMSTKGRKLRHMMFGHEFYFAVSTKLAS